MATIPTGPLYLVAVDGSSPSEVAAAHAFELAGKTHARLRFVTVEDLDIVRAQSVASAGLLALGYESGEAARDAIAQVKAMAEKHKVKAEFEVMPLGEPAASVVREAERVGATLIILGSHGRTGMARALLGSVAERVVRHAHCSVLVVRK